MGSARWYFVMDASNDAQKISKVAAQLLLSSDYVIPDGIPSCDGHGVLLAELVVITRNRRAERVERISLYALPACESAVGESTGLTRSLSAALRMALRRKLGRRKDASLGLDLDEAAFAELDQRIVAGETGAGEYRAMRDRLRDAVQRAGNDPQA